MTRLYERGSVVGFVLVGILLTAALVGGVWFARHPAGSSADTGSDSSATSSDTDSSEGKDITSTTEVTTDEELKETLAEQAAQSSDQESDSSGTSSTSTTAESSKLPATGPADTLFQMVGAAMLSGVTIAYVRSRSVA